MSKFENDYRTLLSEILEEGSRSETRTGVDTFKLFNKSITIDIKQGFPILTGKYIDFAKGLAEYNWIKEGGSTTAYLHKHNIFWWDKFANDRGELGLIYGPQLRNFAGEFDQLMYVIEEIKANSRRAHISLWNPIDLHKQALPVCYTSMTFMRDGNNLNMSINFRSSDTFLGLPYDIIFASLLLIEVAKFTELKPSLVGISIVDAHIYSNHIEQVNEYLKAKTYKLPTYSHQAKMLLDYKHSKFIKTILNV